MKSQAQVLLVALAVSFTVALSLAVALVCVSYLKEDPSFEEESRDREEESTDFIFPLPIESESITQEAESEQPLPDLSGGLRFSSNGDGTCRLTGIGSCSDACVVIPDFSPSGERVVEIAERAFYGCATVSAVQIPATVQRIGALAFAACPNLVYISVSPQNRFFCDMEGILYSADLQRLLLYPPMRAGESLTIRSVTVEISDMAFYQCAYLERVSYTGSAEEWEQMRIGSKNYSLTAASKTFMG